ncbi:uncharacterized protein [Ambystoma mexicanum]|uniref:uncharacterized protein n=1 Tax=Ambystoma mexicanum TaxID=8296 RepID=UPI0037E6FC7F
MKKSRSVERESSEGHSKDSSSKKASSSSSSARKDKKEKSKYSSGDRPRSASSRDAEKRRSSSEKAGTPHKPAQPPLSSTASLPLARLTSTLPGPQTTTTSMTEPTIALSTEIPQEAWRPEVYDPILPETLLQQEALSVSSGDEDVRIAGCADLGLQVTKPLSGSIPGSTSLLNPQSLLSLEVLSTLQTLLKTLDDRLPRTIPARSVIDDPGPSRQPPPSTPEAMPPDANLSAPLMDSDSNSRASSVVSLSPSRDPTWESKAELETLRSLAQPSPQMILGHFTP